MKRSSTPESIKIYATKSEVKTKEERKKGQKFTWGGGRGKEKTKGKIKDPRDALGWDWFLGETKCRQDAEEKEVTSGGQWRDGWKEGNLVGKKRTEFATRASP